jgi:hypothetical protein
MIYLQIGSMEEMEAMMLIEYHDEFSMYSEPT